MDLKTRSERIEGSMLSREYFDESLIRKDKSDLIVSKLDEALRVLAEFQPRKPSIEPSNPSIGPRMPSSTEEAENIGRTRTESQTSGSSRCLPDQEEDNSQAASETAGDRDKHSLRTPQETGKAWPCSKSEPRIVRRLTRNSLTSLQV